MIRNAKKPELAAIPLTDDALELVSGGHAGIPPGQAKEKGKHGGPPWYQPAQITVGTLVQIAGGDATIDF